ncbi:Rv3235 family protein [Streptomyces litchfieldiae]|uniref:Rv3235 family protein n=1 Tax=Streptomyces litchfieldiae TaxID=3075543 RepID=A0ABU2MNK5_9ACTN|nr:Rv3235 family protein [Streptomyces sp. DSM 44938]MDT0343036.1 Rv3235 family protein [Streptomyces sp. DSM 44938]
MKTGKRGPSSRTNARRTDSRRPARRITARRRGPQDWFAEQLLLVLSGQRPVHVMLGHAHQRAYEQLSRLAPRAPLRPPPGGRAPVLVGVGVCRPSSEAIEAFARIGAGDRTRAFAFRLDRRPGDGRWQCSAVELDTVP